MFFASDNAGPVHPSVLEALSQANSGYAMGYGNDALTAEVTQGIRDLFEAPNAAVYLVGTGTAANALALSTLCNPYDTVFCSPVAHIHEDECNAPEFFTGGAKLTLVPGGDRMTPDALRAGRAKTLLGQEVTIKVQDGKARVNDAAIVKTDIDASNGVIHVIDSVLLPKSSPTVR